MKKGGQVAIFVILAISIVVIFSLFFLIPKKVDKVPELDVNIVHSYIYDLIEEEASECFQEVGKRGGYYNIPNELYINETSYWYYEGVNVQPFIGVIENETEKCINEVLKNTFEDILGVFGNESLKINKKEVKSQVIISEWRTRIIIDYPVTVISDDSRSLLSEFKIDYRINILKLYEIASGIVNHAALPDFDKCNPSTDCYNEYMNFSFFNEGDNLFIKGQTFAVSSNRTKELPYELKFAIKRPIKEAFESGGKKLAVLYADDSDYRNFGAKSLEIFNNAEIAEGVDYYDCEDIEGFISKIDSYDIVVITGGMQYQVRKSSIFNEDTGEDEDSYSDSTGELFSGCNAFGPSDRKNKLKNWVNDGGLLWIGGVGKIEADSYEISYLGSLGYESVGWEWGVALDDIEKRILEVAKEGRYTVEQKDILEKTNIILNCPNNISKDIIGSWGFYKISVTSADEIIIGNIDNPSLWTRKLGNGEIVFDNFILKDNIYGKLSHNDDLFSKGIAEKYFVNVLNYLTKFDDRKKTVWEISLVSPINGEEIELPIFEFNSELGKKVSYDLLFVNNSGYANLLTFEEEDIAEERFSGNVFKISLIDESMWSNLSEGRYEWQIKTGEYFSNIGYFVKKRSSQIDEGGSDI